MKATQNYIEALKKLDFSQASETSLRTAFENFINELITEAKLPECKILQEGKRITGFGVPDFRISRNYSMLGYIETKKTDENLDKIFKTEQIVKYRELSDNLILTNYLEFIWIKKVNHEEILQRETLCFLTDLDNKKFQLNEENALKVEKLFLAFFSQTPQYISNPHDLAINLAVRCKNLKDFIHEELSRQNTQNEQERLLDLYMAFKENVFAELSVSEFSDAFAQMLAYGLFLAGLNADTKAISFENAKKFIPASFQLIRELIGFLDELEKPEYKETKWIIDEIMSIINHIQWAELQENLSFGKRMKDKDEREVDPFLYFYETFLAAYDVNLRKAKGVYYTPPEVVNFIVRCLDEILVQTFKLSDGFAERNKVTVLDFATGTGTFLLEVFKEILENIPVTSPEKRKMIVKEHLLQNLFGFEYLIAPYTIAHLKLSQFLKENGYEFQEKDRLQVYLTNTLEPVNRQVKVAFMPQLSRETKTAQEIKDKPILVITGNPPYSGHSQNNSSWIKNEVKKYNFADGKPLGERNPKWLQDDYVKFIRFAQDKMDKAEQGVVGIITNHSFLDNPTFRGMRQSLLNTFDQLYFVDLHGNAKKKEKTPDGGKDENVFDIEQGVCMSFFIKKKGLKKGVFHADFWGNRKTKFKLCLENNLKTVNFEELKPNSPFYLFVPQNQDFRRAYDEFWSVKDIFELNSVGVVTGRDEFTVKSTADEVWKTVHDFVKLDENTARKKYKLGKDSRDWQVKLAQEDLKTTGLHKNLITKINYRPFDVRYTYYTGNSRGFLCMPRKNVMQHFEKENFGLVTVRQVAEGVFNHAFVTEILCNFRVTLSNKGGAYIFPFYRYNGNGKDANDNYLFKENDKKDNFTDNFREFIRKKYRREWSIEQIAGYIYAVLHGKSYREKYSDFLKMDFPRIPFTDSAEIFEKISALGCELIDKHLLKNNFSLKELPDIGEYIGAGDNVVIKPEFKIIHAENQTFSRLYINKTQYFETVTEEIYDFCIGGYRVLDKFLKDRKDKSIAHELFLITDIIKTLHFTLQIMKNIDEEMKGWI